MASAWLLWFCLVAIATGFHAGLRPRGCAPQGLGCAPRQPRLARVSLLEPAAHGTSYQELKSIDSKVDELQSDVIDMLLGFYDSRRSCFALTPGRSRYSITSTCCSLLAVDAARVRWRDQLNVQKVVDALLVEDWRGDDLCQTELTRSPRRLRWARTGYAYQPPVLGTYRRRRVACPQGPAYCTYWVRVPATGVPYVPRTAAPQVPDDADGLDAAAPRPAVCRAAPPPGALPQVRRGRRLHSRRAPVAPAAQRARLRLHG